MCGGEADDHDDRNADERGDGLGQNEPAEQKHARPGERGARVDVLAEDIGHVARKDVAQHAAAGAGEHADEKQQQHAAAVRLPDGGGDAGDGEDAKARRVHEQQRRVEELLAARERPAHGREEQHHRNDQRHDQVDRVLKRLRRRDADDQVADDAAAHGGDHAENGHAEDVHPLFDARQGAAGRERHGAQQFYDEEKRVHRIPPNEKSTPLMYAGRVYSVLLPERFSAFFGGLLLRCMRLSRAPSAPGPFA